MTAFVEIFQSAPREPPRGFFFFSAKPGAPMAPRRAAFSGGRRAARSGPRFAFEAQAHFGNETQPNEKIGMQR